MRQRSAGGKTLNLVIGIPVNTEICETKGSESLRSLIPVVRPLKRVKASQTVFFRHWRPPKWESISNADAVKSSSRASMFLDTRKESSHCQWRSSVGYSDAPEGTPRKASSVDLRVLALLEIRSTSNSRR